MLIYVLVALLNGTFVSVSRTINGRLGMHRGALKASLINHVVGTLILTPLLFLLSQPIPFANLSVRACCGGFLGALFVAVNSYVFPRVGAMKGALLVISGQMMCAVVIDCASRANMPSTNQIVGTTVILIGIYLSKKPIVKPARRLVRE